MLYCARSKETLQRKTLRSATLHEAFYRIGSYTNPNLTPHFAPPHFAQYPCAPFCRRHPTIASLYSPVQAAKATTGRVNAIESPLFAAPVAPPLAYGNRPKPLLRRFSVRFAPNLPLLSPLPLPKPCSSPGSRFPAILPPPARPALREFPAKQPQRR